MSRQSVDLFAVGKSYSKAFLSPKTTEEDIQAFINIGKALTHDPLFYHILSISKRSNQNKKDNLEWMKTIAKKFELPQRVENFIKLIAINGQLIHLKAIVDSVELLSNQKAGRDFVKLTLFKQVSDTDINKIKESIKRSLHIDPILNIVIDPDILGGYIVQTRTIIIDNSLKKRLEKLHNVMKGVA